MPEENNSISRGIVGKKLWLFLLILSGNHFLNSPYSLNQVVPNTPPSWKDLKRTVKYMNNG